MRDYVYEKIFIRFLFDRFFIGAKIFEMSATRGLRLLRLNKLQRIAPGSGYFWSRFLDRSSLQSQPFRRSAPELFFLG